MTSQFFTELHANGVAEIVLNRPPVNALNAAGWYGLAAEIEGQGKRPEVRVIVIRAEGRGFCAGADLSEFDFTPGPDMLKRADPGPIIDQAFNPSTRQIGRAHV